MVVPPASMFTFIFGADLALIALPIVAIPVGGGILGAWMAGSQGGIVAWLTLLAGIVAGSIALTTIGSPAQSDYIDAMVNAGAFTLLFGLLTSVPYGLTRWWMRRRARA